MHELCQVCEKDGGPTRAQEAATQWCSPAERVEQRILREEVRRNHVPARKAQRTKKTSARRRSTFAFKGSCHQEVQAYTRVLSVAPLSVITTSSPPPSLASPLLSRPAWKDQAQLPRLRTKAQGRCEAKLAYRSAHGDDVQRRRVLLAAQIQTQTTPSRSQITESNEPRWMNRSIGRTGLARSGWLPSRNRSALPAKSNSSQ